VPGGLLTEDDAVVLEAPNSTAFVKRIGRQRPSSAGVLHPDQALQASAQPKSTT